MPTTRRANAPGRCLTSGDLWSRSSSRCTRTTIAASSRRRSASRRAACRRRKRSWPRSRKTPMIRCALAESDFVFCPFADRWSMEKPVTYAAIKKKYEGEWVLIIDPVTTKKLEIVKGIVACHSEDRDMVWEKARELKPKHSAVL